MKQSFSEFLRNSQTLMITSPFVANIEDSRVLKLFGADAKAARKAKRLSRKNNGGDDQTLPVSAIRERRRNCQPAGCYTAYQKFRLTCGTVLQPGNQCGGKHRRGQRISHKLKLCPEPCLLMEEQLTGLLNQQSPKRKRKRGM